MKFTKYSKYIPDAAGEMSMEDLLGALSDYLLQSGFQNPYLNFHEMNGEHTLDDLRQAIQDALESGMLQDDDERIQQMLEQLQQEGGMEELIEQIVQRMQQEDFISIDQPFDRTKPSTTAGQAGDVTGPVRFEVTDKGLDALLTDRDP